MPVLLSTVRDDLTISAPQLGKTVAAAAWLLSAMWYGGASPIPWWWMAPTYAICSEGFTQKFCWMARTAGVLADATYSPPLRATLINGARLEGKSWERPGGMFGTTIRGGVIDEFGQLTAAAYSAISSRRAETVARGEGKLRYVGNVGEIGGTAEDLWDMAERGESGFASRRWTWQDRAAAYACDCENQGSTALPTSGSSNQGEPARADVALSLQDAENHAEHCQRGVYMRFIAAEATRMSEPQFRQLYGAEWADWNLLPVFTFDRDVHAKYPELAEYQPELPIDLACDFNVDPMCWVLGQHHGDMAWSFDEIVIGAGASTEAACAELTRRYPNRQTEVVVYGDRSGKSRDTRSKTTDYEIIRKRLQAAYHIVRFEVPDANPSVPGSVNAFNARLRSAAGDVRYHLHPRCVVGIKDLARVSWKQGTRDIDKSDKSLTHWSDAERYRIARLFPITEPGRIATVATTRHKPLGGVSTMEF